MTEFKYNKILLVFILIGLAAALVIGWQRHQLEAANNTVEMVMDYNDIVELARTEGVFVDNLLPQFKEVGLTSLAVYEATLKDLNTTGRIEVLSGSQILAQYHTGGLASPEWRSLVEEKFLDANPIQADEVYIIVNDQPIYEELKQDLSLRLGAQRVRSLPVSGRPVLAIRADYEKVLKWNLGLLSQDMRRVNAAGYLVVARPTNYDQVTPWEVNNVFARLQGIKVSAVVFSAKEILGYPDQLPLTAERMQARQFTLGLIEDTSQLQFYKQAGLLELATATGYRAARVYSIPKDEQARMIPNDPDTINRWTLSDQERDIRINLLRTFDKPLPGKSLVATNLAYVSDVKKALVQEGFQIGPATVFPVYFPPALLLALVMLGAVAASILLLTLLTPIAPRWQYILLAVLAGALIFPVLYGGSAGTLARQMVATVCAVIFPVLALTWQLDRRRNQVLPVRASVGRILLDAALSLVVAVGMALVGGFYLGAALSDTRFFLEMEFFRGVKLAFAAPLLLMAVVYFTRYSMFSDLEALNAKNVGNHAVKILNYPIKVKTLLALGITVLVAGVYMGRSGHSEGVPVPALEIKLRRLLEADMYARPREKEFLFGHPSFFLAVMAVYRCWPRILHFVLVVASVIGLFSLVETFAHMRSPILLSSVRAFTGLGFGLGFGAVAVVGAEILGRVFALWGRRRAGHE